MKESDGSACPVCGAFSSDIFLDQEDSDLASSAIGSSRLHASPGRILRCRSCGFGFRQLRSSPEKLRDLYRDMDARVYSSELLGRERTAKSHLRIVQRQLRAGRMLDVGCASGLFLSQATGAGWKVAGIEPNEALCEEARAKLAGKGDVFCTTLEMASLEGGFHAITLWDVLEHVPDPVAFLSLCSTLLKPEGYLFLNVPDLDSWEARIFGHRWPLLLPEHLNYFNRKSLRVCAERAAFTPVRFGRRMAWFSLRYVAYRTAQHGIPGCKWLQRRAEGRLGSLQIPVSLGETYAVLERRPARELQRERQTARP